MATTAIKSRLIRETTTKPTRRQTAVINKIFTRAARIRELRIDHLPARVQDLILKKQSLRIDLGCGSHKQEGADIVGLDNRALPGVDIVHNLEKFPWPLPSDSCRVAFASHYFEHIKPWEFLPLMAELHRVMKHDGQVLVAGPYGVEFRFVQDPTHCNPINEATFMYWDKVHPSGLWAVYEPKVFHLESFEIIPAGSSRDFNAILRCCKATSEEACRKTHDHVFVSR